MSWILLASLPPFLWSFSNIIDEYLSKNHFKSSAFLMIVAASVIQIIPAGLILTFHDPVFDFPWQSILVMCLLGAGSMACFVPYIKAIQIDGASVAVPIFQVIPVFTFILAWIFLGEVVGAVKIFAAALIVCAAFGITWDFHKKSISHKTLIYMFSASMGLAIYNVVTRHYLADIDWVTMLGWAFVGTRIWGMMAIILKPKWGKELYTIATTGGARVSILFFIQLALDVLAFGCFVWALSLAPAAGLVSTLNGLQPFYVLMISAVAGALLPQYFKKAHRGKALAWQVLCIMVLFVGVAILSLSE